MPSCSLNRGGRAIDLSDCDSDADIGKFKHYRPATQPSLATFRKNAKALKKYLHHFSVKIPKAF
jgi:hypothetical protein